MREVAIVGVGIHKFGRFGDKPFTEIGAEAVRMALTDAGVNWRDIQTASCGKSSPVIPRSAGVRVGALLGKTGIGITDVDAGCASGAVALKQVVLGIQSGRFDLALAFGVEKRPKGFMDPGEIYEKWQIEMGLSANPGYWALSARRHMHDYGTTELQLAKIAYKNHRNSVHNPYAMYRKAFTLEEIMNSKMVCDPIRLLAICAPNEGAAAVVLCPSDKAHKFTSKPVIVASCVHSVAMYSADFRGPMTQLSNQLSNPNPTAMAADKAYQEAGIGPEDVDVAEVQDTDAFMELSHYEELGFCRPGESGRMVDEGATEIGGRIPVNCSGGLISKGEPVGASHLGQVVDLVWQLRGVNGPRQVQDAKVALALVTGVFGHSGITVLKR
jgi:acetyl-CoA acetyltransferase